jgi:hypothetical protein
LVCGLHVRGFIFEQLEIMASSKTLAQPPHRHPFQQLEKWTDAFDMVGLNCRLMLWLHIGPNLQPQQVSFVVDTGASYSSIPIHVAQKVGLALPTDEFERDIDARTMTGPTSMRVRPGRIRAWWNADLQGYPFDWPVLFRMDAPAKVPPTLGLGGVVKTCRWIFDGSYAPDAPFGHLTLEDIR